MENTGNPAVEAQNIPDTVSGAIGWFKLEYRHNSKLAHDRLKDLDSTLKRLEETSTGKWPNIMTDLEELGHDITEHSASIIYYVSRIIDEYGHIYRTIGYIRKKEASTLKIDTNLWFHIDMANIVFWNNYSEIMEALSALKQHNDSLEKVKESGNQAMVQNICEIEKRIYGMRANIIYSIQRLIDLLLAVNEAHKTITNIRKKGGEP